MDRHTPERFENFEAIVKDCEEALECYLITGQNADYLLKVISRIWIIIRIFYWGD